MMIQSYFLMIVWFFSLPVSASLQQGKDFGNKMLSQYGDLAIKVKPAEVLPYYTSIPKETGLNESTLDKNVVETMKTHPSARLVKESEEKRGKHFKIHEDPMVLFSKEISQDPLALLSKFYKNCKEVSVEGSPVKVETEFRTCEEGGESYLLTCTKTLVVTPPLKTKKYGYTHISGKQFRRSGRNYGQIVSQTRGPRNVGHDQWYDYKQTTFIPDQKINYFDGCNYYPHTVKNYYKYEKKIGTKAPVTITESEYLSKTLKPEDVLETWTSTCDLLEEKVDSGLCINVEVPSFSMNCTNMDLVLGSFSVLSSKQLMDALHGIARNAAAYALQLGLQVVTPQVKAAVDQLMAVLQNVNGMSQNSCLTGQLLAAGLLPKNEAMMKHLCKSKGMSIKIAEDWAGLDQACSTKAADIGNRKVEGFEDVLAGEFNLAWKPLQKNEFLKSDEQLASLMMSLSGSLISKKGQGDQFRRTHLPSLLNNQMLIDGLIYGGREAEIYVCDDKHEDKCLNPTRKKTALKVEGSLFGKVQGILDSMTAKLREDTPMDKQERAFVNATSKLSGFWRCI